MLPRVRITDLLSEVGKSHNGRKIDLQTGAVASDERVIMAGILTDELNLGLTRTSEACTIASLG